MLPSDAKTVPVMQRRFGRYELLEELGRGGMGVVYKALDPQLNRPVALKVILHASHASPEVLARFRREAEAVAQLQHPNIVPVHDAGEQDGAPFYTMALLKNGTLVEHPALTSRDPRAVAALFVAISRAVGAAHKRGIVHRDLKPANILLGPDGEPLVSDFGLAKRLDEAAMTVSGAVLGTPAYMSPEQLHGDIARIGPAADVYSLGVMLYEALTGQRPFAGGNDLQALRRATDVEPTPPSRLARRLPRDLEKICLHCLRATPEARYADAGALADDLERFLHGEPVHARRIGVALRLTKWCRRHPVMTIAGALTLASIVAALYMVWWAYAYRVTYVAYYGNLTYRFGQPAGLFEVTPEAMQRRKHTFEVTRRGRYGPVTEVRIVNGFGRDAPDNPFRTWFDGVLSAKPIITWTRNRYHYDERRRLLRELAYDAYGNLVYELQFAYDERVPVASSTEPRLASARYFRERGLDLTEVAGPTTIAFERDERGLDRVVRFTDGAGRAKTNGDGAFGYEIEYTDHGLMRRVMMVDMHGRVFTGESGYAGVELDYDAAGRERSTTLLDAAGTRTTGRDGVSRTELTYDANGNPKLIRFLNADDKAVRRADWGVAAVEWVCDERGGTIRERYLDEEGTLVAGPGGAASLEMGQDAFGRLEKLLTRDVNGSVLAVGDHHYNSAGQLIKRVLWQDESRKIELGWSTFKYVDGRLVLESVGSGDRRLLETQYDHDKVGRVERVRHFKGDPPEPAHVEDGYSVIERRFHDPDHRHSIVAEVRRSGYEPSRGYHIVAERFDSEGRLIGRQYLRENGSAAPGPHGYSRLVLERDAVGRITGCNAFDAAGNAKTTVVEVVGIGRDPAATTLRIGDRIDRYAGESVLCAQALHERRAQELRDRRPVPVRVTREGQSLELQLLRADMDIAFADVVRR